MIDETPIPEGDNVNQTDVDTLVNNNNNSVGCDSADSYGSIYNEALENNDDVDINSTLIVVILILIGIILYKVCYRFYGSPYHTRTVQGRSLASGRNEKTMNINERYDMIESSLLSMFVAEQVTTSTIVDPSNNDRMTVTDSKPNENGSCQLGKARNDVCHDDETGDLCPICLEQYQAGDIVSMTLENKSNCAHVFHHSCIKEWLLQNDTCPSCRIQILPKIDSAASSNDDPEGDEERNTCNKYMVETNQNSNSVERLNPIYYVHLGVILHDASNSITKSLHALPTREQLVSLRVPTFMAPVKVLEEINVEVSSTGQHVLTINDDSTTAATSIAESSNESI